ncbi:MAG: hypothetical protein ACU0CI_04025 [Shimia sp.]
MKRFAAWITAGALALATVTPTTAFATDNEDIGKFVAGAIGLLILKEIIENEKKDAKRAASKPKHQPQHQPKPKAQVHHPRPVPQQRVHKPRPHPHVTHRPYRPYAGKPHHKTLPQRCLFQLRTDRGMKPVFGRVCMTRHHPAVHRLPDDCFRSHWTHKGWRYGWAPRCLSRNGYVW